MNIETLTDAQLATCVDEYVKRVMNKARSLDYKDCVDVTIMASQYYSDRDYDIEHCVSVGSYPKQQKATGSNAIQGIVRAIMAHEVEVADRPTTVTVMLPAPTLVDDNTEEAEFSDISF